MRIKLRKSLTGKVVALVVGVMAFAVAVVFVFAIRAIDAGTNDSIQRQESGAVLAAKTLGQVGTSQVAALQQRLLGAAHGSPTTLAAYSSAGGLGQGTTLVAVSRDGRVLAPGAGGRTLALAKFVSGPSSTASFEVIPASDLAALGLKGSTTVSVKPSATGVPVNFKALNDGLAEVASVPVADGGRLIAIRPLAYDWDLVDNAASLMGKGAYVTVFQGDVRIATTVRKAGKRAVGTTVSPKVRAAVYGKGRPFTGEALVVGQPVIAHYELIRNAAGQPVGMWFAGYLKSGVEATGSDAKVTMLIAGLIVLLLGALVAAIFGSRVLAPLRELTPKLEAMAEGDLDQHAEIRSNDEVGAVARAFSRMTESLREKVAVIRQIAQGDLSVEVHPRSDRDELGRATADMAHSLRELVSRTAETATAVAASSQEMAATSEETGKSVGEIATALQHVAQGAERQVQSVSSARQSAEAVAEAVAASARDAEKATTVAQDAQRVAEEGVRAATEAAEAMEHVRTSSQEGTDAIRALAAKSNQIGAIVETISGISEQTNLLALNAAIEAARAGEQGRGFAVVAEEVRKLAEQSSTAASEIAELLGEVQNDTTHAVAVVEAGAERTQDGVTTVTRTREAFERIGQSVTDVTTHVDRIAQSAQQIAEAAELVQQSITEASAVAEESSASTEEVTASTESTSASTEEIAASAQELAQNADVLARLVHQFKLEA